MQGFENYDDWKLDNGDTDLCECEGCEIILDENRIEETSFIDADGDRRSLWLCVKCVENQIWV